MAKLTFFKEKPKLINFLFLTIAGVVNAVGVSLFLMPAMLIDGGLSGLSYILSYFVTPHLAFFKVSIFLVILNFPFFLFAFKKYGATFILYSLYAISFYSFFVFVFRDLLQLTGADGLKPIVDDILLCAIFGGLISGCGSGLTIRAGGSLDGIEIIALVINKKVQLSVGTIVLMFNIVMFVIAGLAMGQWEFALYSIIAYAGGVKAVDLLVEGLDKAKAVMIITTKGMDVAKAINDNMGRGITMIDSYGYYSKQTRNVIYYVVNRFDIQRLKRLILSVDKTAFVSITDVSDIMGSSVKAKKKVKNKKEILIKNLKYKKVSSRQKYATLPTEAIIGGPKNHSNSNGHSGAVNQVGSVENGNSEGTNSNTVLNRVGGNTIEVCPGQLRHSDVIIDGSVAINLATSSKNGDTNKDE